MSDSLFMPFDKSRLVSTDELIESLAKGSRATQEEGVRFLVKKSEISGSLFARYHHDGKKASVNLCSKEHAPIALQLICQEIEGEYLSNFECLKYINAASKLIERNSLIEKAKNLAVSLDSKLDQVLAELSVESRLTEPSKIEGVFSGCPLRVLPVTVLFWRGPIARAYLATLKACGYKPKKIIHLLSSRDLANGKPLYQWLPDLLKKPLCKLIHRSRSHYWSVAM